MTKYLGTIDVTKEHGLNPTDGALLFLQLYGGIDGSHHKNWVLDQVARILNGATVTVEEASWSNGETELRYNVGTSEQYEQWVIECKDGEEGSDSYEYSKGIAP